MGRAPVHLAAGLLALAGAAAAAPGPSDFEACVTRHPGDAGRAAREACFAGLLGQASPGTAPAAPVVAPAPPAAPAVARPVGLDAGSSQFNRLWGSASERSELRAGEYHANYLLPYYKVRRPNLAPRAVGAPAAAGTVPSRQDTEAKFQLSLKGHVWPKDEQGAHDLWIGYTQVSHWQVWNEEASRPFRETNYEPELIYTWEPEQWSVGGWRIGHFGASLNHQSNGRGGLESRSWNRLVGFVRAERGDTLVSLRAWTRLKEGGADENPHVEDHYGRADLQVSHQFANGTLLMVTGRHSLRAGERNRGSVQVDLSTPLCRERWSRWLCADNLRAHAQFYRGYGESLIDYNHLDTYYGLGLSFAAWK